MAVSLISGVNGIQAGALASLSSVGTTQIDDLSVTYAKIQNISDTDKLLGRSSLGAGVVQEITCTTAGRSLLSGATASAQRTSLELGTIATQAASSVSISGGSITGITDLALADGGTGASTALNARANLGLGTMSTQAASSVAITGGDLAGVTYTGLTTGAYPASGKIGEIISASVAYGSPIQLNNAVVTPITNITLSAGNWLIFGSCGLNRILDYDGMIIQFFVGTAAGTSTTGRDLAVNTTTMTPDGGLGGFETNTALPLHAVSITGSTTYYLKAVATYTIEYPRGYGTITAMRIS